MKKILGFWVTIGILVGFQLIAGAVQRTNDYLTFDTETQTLVSCDKNASGEIVIPDKFIDYFAGISYEVKGIAENSFSGCTNITSVTMPDSITEIGRDAFSGCTGLSSIELSSGLKIIGNDAFENCSSLTEINIPDGVEEIGGYVFYNCVGLTHIVVPDSVTNLDKRALVGGFNLESIVIGSGLPSDWTLYMFDSKKQSEPYKLKTLVLNSGTVPRTEFDWRGLSNIDLIIGKKVVNMSDLPWLLNYYEEHIVQSINTTDECENFYADGKALYSKDKKELIGYLNVGEEKTFDILPTTEHIDEYVFQECTNLETLYLPNGLKEIGKGNFNYTTKLTKIVIPDSVEVIGNFCFTNCLNLENVYAGKGIREINDLFTVDSGSDDWFGPIPNTATFYVYKDSELEKYLIDINSDMTVDWYEEDFGYRPQAKIVYIDDNNDLQPTAKIKDDPKIVQNDDETYTVQVSLEEVTLSSSLVTVLQNDNGQMNITSTPLSSGDMEKDIILPENNPTTVKIFIWDSLQGMRPLCEPKIISVE